MLKLPEFKSYIEPLVAAVATEIGLPASAIKWPNAPFNPPANAPYLSLVYLAEEKFTATLGKVKTRRHVGGLQFEIYLPPETGTAIADAAAEPITRRFDDRQYKMGHNHCVTFKSVEEMSFDVEGKHRSQLRVAYTRDVTA